MILKNSKSKGFTLIELLVVISIIALLSSVVLSSLNSARVRARDAKRLVDIKQLVTAISLYLNDNNGNFPSNAGCLNGWCCLGHGDAGTCWTVGSGYHGSTALDTSLSPKYISKISDDPLNNTTRYGDAYMYRTFVDANGTSVATLHWGIENPNPTIQNCAGDAMGNWGTGNGNGGNYFCMLDIR